MKNRFFISTFLLFLVLWSAACVPAQPTPVVSHGGPVVDYVSLVDALRKNGATVSPAGEISQPFFSETGQVLEVNGTAVQVFEYADVQQRLADSNQIAPDGSKIGNTAVTWVDQPNFWATERLIILYVGRDASTLTLLNQTLGKPLTPHSQISADEMGAVQIPEQTQVYVDLSREMLAQELGLEPDAIKLASVTEPPSTDGTYIVQLTAQGNTYEFHGRNGQVLPVSAPSPTEPDRWIFSPAVVEEAEVRIDEQADTPVAVVVRGHFPDNCTELHEGRVSMIDEHTFQAWLVTRRPAGEACGEVLVPYETVISLGVEARALPAGEYTLLVNDQVTTTFRLALED